MATNKGKHAFWLTPEAKAMVEEDAHADNCGSQSEFVGVHLDKDTTSIPR